MDFLNLQNLALGGVFAAVVGFWGQVKNVLRYVSSAVVIQASLDTTLSYAVAFFAKHNWKTAPSGLKTYRTVYLEMKAGTWRHVPYLSVNQNMLVYKGFQFMFLKLTMDGDVKIWHIRGFANVEDLIVQGLRLQEQSTGEKAYDRFRVQTLLGREKGMWAADMSSNRGSSVSEDAPQSVGSATIANSSGNIFRPNHLTDVSFMYDKSEILFNVEADPLEGLFYDAETLKHLQDAEMWLKAEKWYADRSIPWKRGWLIHGPGGTGKSSLALATAKTLKIPLYRYMLSTMSDREFIDAWENMSSPCAALFEDFDTVFNKRESLTEHKSLTFDCVLNQISGVKNLSGVFLIVTTNHIDKIDEALGIVSSDGSISTRPGRVDRVIYLGPASLEVKTKMAKHILRDWPDSWAMVLSDTQDYTAVQFQEKCISYAFNRLARKGDYMNEYQQNKMLDQVLRDLEEIGS